MMDNTVGSRITNNLLSHLENAYILGLWCADGYYRSSSVGLSNMDIKMIQRFSKFFLEIFEKNRLRIRVYYPRHSTKPRIKKEINQITQHITAYPMEKCRHVSYQLYVNSRPLLRCFLEAKNNLGKLDNEVILAYLAGRFDGDGSIDKNLKQDFRIVYGEKSEAARDQELLQRIRQYETRLYYYQKANTHCLYMRRQDTPKILEDLYPYSIKIKKLVGLPRRD